MTFRILFPRALDPERLDHLLARGWFRMRRSVFTTRYLLDTKGLHTAVWARLSLDDYTFRSSLRRRMRTVERGYQVSEGPARPGHEERALYRRYVKHVGGDRPDELADVLGEEPGQLSPFDTWQISIRRPDGALVAYSLFDVGIDSMQSIIGVYDPDHARDGLGFATMLFEIRHGIDRGFRYHYPGYVVEGVKAFDYKREVGALDYRDPIARRWRPLAELDPATLPDRTIRAMLDGVLDALERSDDGGPAVPAALRCYPPFQLVHVHGAQRRCLAEPMFVVAGPVVPGKPQLAVTVDPDTRTWMIDAWMATRDLSHLLDQACVPEEGPPAEWHILTRAARIGVVDSAEAAAAQLTRAWRNTGAHIADPTGGNTGDDIGDAFEPDR